MPSTGLVPNIAEAKMAGILVNQTSAENLVLHLYKNDLTPTSTMTLADYTEATFTGYAPITLSSANWTVTEGYQAQATYSSDVSFECSGTTSESVYGFYLTTALSSTLMWSERFGSAPRTVTYSGDAFSVQPSLVLTRIPLIGQDDYWKLDEASGARLDSIEALTLTDNGGVLSTSDDDGNAALFDRSSSGQYLSRPANGAELYPQGDFTYTLWIYPTGVATIFPVPEPHGVIHKDSASSIDRPIITDWYPGYDLFRFTITSSSGGLSGVDTPASIIPNQWHHLAFGYSTLDKKARLWANGIGPVIAGTALFSDPPISGSCPFFIGAANGSGLPARYFDGRIRGVHLFHRLLSDAEVLVLAGHPQL